MFRTTARMFFTALLVALCFQARASQKARATFFCLSLRFQQGTDAASDGTLDLSSLPGPPNGELAAWFDVYTHRSLFALDRNGFPISGTLYLDLPQVPNANTNAFDDNFEVSQAVAATSYGEYTTTGPPAGGGAVTATWNRAAGSSAGLCQLHLVDDQFGDLGVYRHTFEVLELTGPLAYTPGSNTVNGYINLTNAVDRLHGPVRFTKLATTNFNHLTRDAGAWTNAAWQSVPYSEGTFERDWRWPTNYYGTVEFEDGNRNTSGADYRRWMLSVDDPNDGDHDGIPDLSDTPPAAAALGPVLSLSLGSNNLWLTISGEPGRMHHILESCSPVAGDWKTNSSLVLTNDPQTVSLPLPAEGIKFWRVRVE